jgi:hypothetical protein
MLSGRGSCDTVRALNCGGTAIVMDDAPSDKITIPSAQEGAAVQNLFHTRTVVYFQITEDEMDQLGSLNYESNICLVVGSGLISIAATIAVSHIFTEKTTPADNLLCYVVAPLLLFLSLVAFWFCKMFMRRRGEIRAKIIATSVASRRSMSNTAAAQQGASSAQPTGT